MERALTRARQAERQGLTGWPSRLGMLFCVRTVTWSATRRHLKGGQAGGEAMVGENRRRAVLEGRKGRVDAMRASRARSAGRRRKDWER